VLIKTTKQAIFGALVLEGNLGVAVLLLNELIFV